MDTPTNAVPVAGTAPAASAPVPTPTPAAPAPVAAPAATPEAPASAPLSSAKPDLRSLLSRASPAERLLIATGKFSELKPAASSAPASTPAPAEPAAPAAAPAESAPAPAEAAAEPAPAVAEPGTPAATPEGASPAEGAPGSEGESKGKRFRFSSEDDQAVAQLAKSRGISLVEASRIYAGDAPPAAATTPAQAPAAAEPAAPAVDPVIASYETTLAEKREQIKKLTSERETAKQDLDDDKRQTLSEQLVELKADVRFLENEMQGHLRSVKESTQGAYDRGVAAARDRVFGEYPTLASETSMERLALDAYVDRALKDPARKAEFRNPNWPVAIAKEFAEKHGIKPKVPPVGSPPAPVPAAAKPASPFARPQPQQVAAPSNPKLLTGADGKSTPSASRPLTRERALELIRNDPEARRAIIAKKYPGAR